MYRDTLEKLRCVSKKCSSSKKRSSFQVKAFEERKDGDVWFGSVSCSACSAKYPVLYGVLCLLEDLDRYFFFHLRGVEKLCDQKKIPKDLPFEIEDTPELDTESIQGLSAYIQHHYQFEISVKKLLNGAFPEPYKDHLLKNQVKHKTKEFLESKNKKYSVLEFASSVGGFYEDHKELISSYLGVDLSFLSVAWARHIHFSAPFDKKVFSFDDLLFPKKEELTFSTHRRKEGVDFIVSSSEEAFFYENSFDLTVAMNLIDMLDEPMTLVEAQKKAIDRGGAWIECSPYVWRRHALKNIEKESFLGNSSESVKSWYQKSGLKIDCEFNDLPWVFVKQSRQAEIYSCDLLMGEK